MMIFTPDLCQFRNDKKKVHGRLSFFFFLSSVAHANHVVPHFYAFLLYHQHPKN
ncbi:hypothetical protein BC940DRAFT_290498, partial [Gongronella butleri]